MEHIVIKEGAIFLLTNKRGEIVQDFLEGYGLYTRDTQFLSHYQILFEGKELELAFSSAAKNFISQIILGNPEIQRETNDLLPRLSIHFERNQRLSQTSFHETLLLKNFNLFPVKGKLTFFFGSEFRDIFEIRGAIREKRGDLLKPKVNNNEVVLGYIGLDDITRSTTMRFIPCPSSLTNSKAVYEIELDAKGEMTIEITAIPKVQTAGAEKTKTEQLPSYRDWFVQSTSIVTDNPFFNEWIRRSLFDLRMLLTDFGQGPVPVAGIPWFVTLFGRDSIITSLQMLMFNPQIAKNTLFTLAARQGTAVNKFRDEEPGKIMHEMRLGEMAILKEIPFGLYYGSVDATPLFIILFVEYYWWTKDINTARTLLPAVLRALEWMERYGDQDQDLYLEFGKQVGTGLQIQSWKDSNNSMIHPFGRLANPPLAVSEVQGYTYYAKKGLSRILYEWGYKEFAQKLENEAGQLKQKFNQDFWMEDKQFYALALEENGTQVKTITSDPGHCLWAEIIDPMKAAKIVDKFVSKGLFSGWGIRTMSAKELPFDPLSYHNGSVWPHDNSIIILGLKKYGYGDIANQIITGMFQTIAPINTRSFPVSTTLEYGRLPELFSGYEKKEYNTPVLNPVSSSPQAWAAGSALMMVQSILGLFPDPYQPILYIQPTLPPWLNMIEVRGLRFQNGQLNFSIHRQGDKAVISSIQNSGGVKLMMRS